MENYTHPMTERNNKIISFAKSFCGEEMEIEYFRNFINEGIKKQLFSLINNPNEKLSEEEFDYLMFNIDNLKELIVLCTDEQLKAIEDYKKEKALC